MLSFRKLFVPCYLFFPFFLVSLSFYLSIFFIFLDNGFYSSYSSFLFFVSSRLFSFFSESLPLCSIFFSFSSSIFAHKLHPLLLPPWSLYFFLQSHNSIFSSPTILCVFPMVNYSIYLFPPHLSLSFPSHPSFLSLPPLTLSPSTLSSDLSCLSFYSSSLLFFI